MFELADFDITNQDMKFFMITGKFTHIGDIIEFGTSLPLKCRILFVDIGQINNLWSQRSLGNIGICIGAQMF